MTTTAAALPEVMRQPAAVFVRDHGLLLLSQIDVAFEALAATGEPDALHDVRVAIRRLRSWLRSYSELLPVPVRRHRQLRKLMRASNRERDRTVAVTILQRLLNDSNRDVARTADHLVKELASLDGKQQAAVQQLMVRWRHLSRKLHRALKSVSDEGEVTGSFLDVCRKRISEQHKILRQRLIAARKSRMPEHVHRARIAAKRLRYLVEPLAEYIPAAAEAVASLKLLQDAAGEIQDLTALLQWLESRYVEQAELCARRIFHGRYIPEQEPENKTAGEDDHLLALATRIVAERHSCIQAFTREFLEPRTPVYLTQVRRVMILLSNTSG